VTGSAVSLLRSRQEHLLFERLPAVPARLSTEGRLDNRLHLDRSVLVKARSEPRSKHFLSVVKTNQLMPYKEIIAVFSEIHTNQMHCVGRTYF